MRTNIEINDELMAKALAASGCSTKKEVVETALQLLVRVGQQSDIKRLRGRLKWEGSLDDMRREP